MDPRGEVASRNRLKPFSDHRGTECGQAAGCGYCAWPYVYLVLPIGSAAVRGRHTYARMGQGGSSEGPGMVVVGLYNIDADQGRPARWDQMYGGGR